MTLYSERIIFPEGDWQDAPCPLRIDQLVDPNGYPMNTPLPSPRILAFRVFRITTKQERGEEIRCYHLEQMSLMDLEEFL